jgi:heat shock protein HslJ
MKKTTLWVTVIILLIVSILSIKLYKPSLLSKNTPPAPTTSSPFDPKNASYTIDGNVFTLKDGKASQDIAPRSATKNTLQIFGEPVYGDINGDSINDIAILLVNNPGGSGTFYYAVLAVSKNGTHSVTNALLLGDRIAPQTIAVSNGRAVYNYAERKAGEPMTTPPSLGKSLYVHYDAATGEIGEWVKDFEGESSPSVMKLDMKKWEWVKTQMNDGTVVTPKKPGVFSLAFEKNGSVTITTDCNSSHGSYSVNKNFVTFGEFASTKMYCEGAQEGVFMKSIRDISSYTFTSKGELILEIKMDSGSMIFR